MSVTPTAPGSVEPTCTGIESDLGWGLGTIFRSYLKVTTVLMAEVPGGPKGYQVLAGAESGLKNTQLALAQQLGIDRTVMTYLLDDLERAELIQRMPDPSDRRVRRVAVTAKGSELVIDMRQRLGEAEDAVLAALDRSDRETFRGLLSQLAARAHELDPSISPCEAAEEIADADAVPLRRAGRQ